MTQPSDLLSTYAKALAAAGGDAEPLWAADKLLKTLGVSSARGVLNRLKRVKEEATEAADGASSSRDAHVILMADRLRDLVSILRITGRAPAWLAIYIDILEKEGARSASVEQIAERFRQTKRPRRKHIEQSMTSDTETAVAEDLATAIDAESRKTDGSESAIRALDAASLTKSVAIEIAKRLTGAVHRSKKAAIEDVQSWYWHRRASRKSAAKIATSARTL